VPTIVFSHSFNDELLDAARAAGAIQCLNKNSVSPNRLMEIVRSALAVPAAGLAAATPAQPTAPAGDRAKARAALAHNATATDAKLNVLLQAFAAAADSKERLSALAPLRTSFKHLADEADTAALPRLIMLAHSVDIMLQDLQEHPDEITTSSFRVLARAMEVIPSLFLARPQPEREPPVLAAVVHTQRGVAPLLAESLRLVGQPAVAFRDTDSAIAFSENNPLGLVIVDLELARPDGGDFVRRSQAIPGHAHVPAVLLSNQPPAATLVPSYLLAHQVLNYPFTASEVVVSAVVRMVKRA
jgi:CheY-like chemotaxis protein